MLEAVIFDFDGTLVDTESIKSLAYEKTILFFGASPVKNSLGLVHYPGKSRSWHWRMIKDTYNLNISEDDFRDKRLQIYGNLINRVEFMDGVFDTLNKLVVSGKRLGLVTLSDRIFVEKILNNLNASHFFETVITGDDAKRHKPDPEAYVLCLDRLGIEKEKAIAVEDTEQGVQSAKDAGLRVLAVPNVHTKDQDFGVADTMYVSIVDINFDIY